MGKHRLEKVANEILEMILAVLGEARLQQSVSDPDGSQSWERGGCLENQAPGVVKKPVLHGLLAKNDAS